MPPVPKHSRRWFQFGLGAMLVWVTVLAVALGWELNFIRERRAFLQSLQKQQLAEIARSNTPVGSLYSVSAVYPPVPAIPFWRRWLGDEPQDVITFPRETPPAEMDKAKMLFPEATLYDADGVECQ